LSFSKKAAEQEMTSMSGDEADRLLKDYVFAASVNREIIMECEAIGIPLNEFAELSVVATLEISFRLGV